MDGIPISCSDQLPSKVNIVNRIHELIGDRELDVQRATVTYTLTMGYERLHVKDGDYTFRYEAALHPNDKCEGITVCMYCGKVLDGSR